VIEHVLSVAATSRLCMTFAYVRHDVLIFGTLRSRVPCVRVEHIYINSFANVCTHRYPTKTHVRICKSLARHMSESHTHVFIHLRACIDICELCIHLYRHIWTVYTHIDIFRSSCIDIYELCIHTLYRHIWTMYTHSWLYRHIWTIACIDIYELSMSIHT